MKTPARIRLTIPKGQRSADLGFFEEVGRDAFTKSLQAPGSDCVALFNHEPTYPLGRQSNGTLTLADKPDALEADVELDLDDPMHVSVGRRVARGDVKASSFGFETVSDRWQDLPGGAVLRTLLEVRLLDVSPVVFAAYPTSSADARDVPPRRAVSASPHQRLAALRDRELKRRERQLAEDARDRRRRGRTK